VKRGREIAQAFDFAIVFGKIGSIGFRLLREYQSNPRSRRLTDTAAPGKIRNHLINRYYTGTIDAKLEPGYGFDDRVIREIPRACAQNARERKIYPKPLRLGVPMGVLGKKLLDGNAARFFKQM